MITYKPLKTEFTHKGFRYNQLYREGDFAIFHMVAEKGTLHQKSFDCGFEVVIIKRHDGYELAGTKIEPAEVYPGTSQWGSYGWTYRDLYHAELKFQELVTGKIPVDENPVEIETESENELQEESGKIRQDPAKTTVPDTAGTPSVKHRGRPKVDRPSLLIPVGEFSTKELAEFNKVDYPIAAVFMKENPTAIKFVRSERRNAKGKPTNLFTKA
jgi:hypothetical protein